MKRLHAVPTLFFFALMLVFVRFLPAQELKVRMAYFPNVTHAQALVGAQRGDFAEALEGRGELVLLPVNAGPTVIEGLFAGEIDIAYVGPSPTLNGHIKARGEVVRLVSGSAFNGVVILGNKGLGITKLEQLRGGRVATPQLGNTQDLAARFFLKEQGFDLGTEIGQTRVIPVANPDVETLFARGDLEGAWIPEPWGSRLVARGLANQIAFEHDFWPAGRFALTGIVVRRAFLDQHPDIVRAILAAHIRITAEMQRDPAGFVGPINDEIFRITKKRLEEEVIRLSLENVVLDVQPDTDTYQRYLRIGQELGHLDRDAVPLDALYDFRILRELLDDAGEELNTAAAATAGAAPREVRQTEFLLSAATALLLLSVSVGLHLGWFPAIGGIVWSRRLLPVLFLVFLAFGWQAIAALQLFPSYLFPGPLAVVSSIWELLRDGTLWTSFSSSATRG